MSTLRSFRNPVQPWPSWVRNLIRVLVGAAIVVTAVVLMQMPLEAQGWAVVAYAVALGDTTGQSVAAGWNRIKGTIVGVVVGAGVGYLLGAAPALPRVCLALGLTLVICQFVPVAGGLRLAVALSGFFAFLPVDQEIATSGWRFVATILGILVAIAVSVLLWPDTALRRLRSGIVNFADDTSAVLAMTVPTWSTGRSRTEDSPQLRAAMTRVTAAPERLRALLADTHHELPGRGPSAAQYSAGVAAVAQVAVALERLVSATRPACSLAPHVAAPITSIGDDAAQALSSLGEVFQDPEATSVTAGTEWIGDPVRRMQQAVDELRAAHVTQQKDAGELLDLFGVLGAMLHVAEGADAAVKALTGDQQAVVPA